jgi:hypothetical protein
VKSACFISCEMNRPTRPSSAASKQFHSQIQLVSRLDDFTPPPPCEPGNQALVHTHVLGACRARDGNTYAHVQTGMLSATHTHKCTHITHICPNEQCHACPAAQHSTAHGLVSYRKYTCTLYPYGHDRTHMDMKTLHTGAFTHKQTNRPTRHNRLNKGKGAK